MFDTLNQRAGDELIQSLDTLGFITAEPTHRTAPPADAVLLTMPFRGPACGLVQVVAPRELGALLASNLAPAGPGSTPSQREGDDALRELLNITCGALFWGASRDAATDFDIALPQLADFDVDAHWESFVAPDTVVLDAEGLVVAIRVIPQSSRS